MSELHDAILASREAATDDGLDTWAASVWAMPEAALQKLAHKFSAVIQDAAASGAERSAANYLLDAVELALRDEMPPRELMRKAAAASGQVATEVQP